jgi:hypothetical protein
MSVAADLYEIPITLRAWPPRKPIPAVAPLRNPKAGRKIIISIRLIHRKASLPGCGDGQPTMTSRKEHSMMDFLMLALAFGLFALAIGYTYACERL